MDKLKDVVNKVVHDLNGPLCTINISLRNVERHLPQLIQTYRKAREMGLEETSISDEILDILASSMETYKERIDYCSSYLSTMAENINKAGEN